MGEDEGLEVSDVRLAKVAQADDEPDGIFPLGSSAPIGLRGSEGGVTIKTLAPKSSMTRPLLN